MLTPNYVAQICGPWNLNESRHPCGAPEPAPVFIEGGTPHLTRSRPLPSRSPSPMPHLSIANGGTQIGTHLTFCSWVTRSAWHAPY